MPDINSPYTTHNLLLASFKVLYSTETLCKTSDFTSAEPCSMTPVVDSGSNQISIDFGGDVYDLDTEIRPFADFEYKLSPTHTILYSKKNTNNGCSPGEVRIFFHTLDSPPDMTSLIPGGVCMKPPVISGGPLFHDDPGDPVRTAVVISDRVNSTSNFQKVLWVDLTGGSNPAYVLDGASYRYIVGWPEFAPSGNAVFVRHGYNNPTSGKYDKYTLIDLCANPVPGSTIAVQSTREHPIEATRALVVKYMWGHYALVLPEGGTIPFGSFPLIDDCFGSSPDDKTLTVAIDVGIGKITSTPPGIECGRTSGPWDATNCEYDYTENTDVSLTATPFSSQSTTYAFTGWSGDCSGINPTTTITMDDNKTCGASFMKASATISKTAPVSVTRGDEFDYVLDYNVPLVPLTNVTIQDTLPAGLTLVSVANGGTESGGVVTWNLGNVAGATSGSVGFRVRTSCTTASPIINDTYAISSTETGPKPGTTVSTNFISGNTSPVNVGVGSTPQWSPLKSGDLITHVITLTNTVAQERICLRMPLQAGSSMDFDTLINNGGGTMAQHNQDNWEWTGNIAPNATATISFTTLVEGCLPGSADSVILNNGTDIRVFSESTLVGSARPPGPFPVKKPVAASFSVINLGPPQYNYVMGSYYQAARAGSILDFQLTLTNQFPIDIPTVVVEVSIPSGLTPVGNPPFIPPTDPGAVFNSGTNTVSWSGPLTASQSVSVTFQVMLNPGAPCESDLHLIGSRASCSDISKRLAILNVPEPPNSPYIVGLGSYQGLYTWIPDVDTGYQELLCMPGEIYSGTGKSVNGDIWVAGLPTFRFNPKTLDFKIFDPALFDAVGISGALTDVAIDPNDQTAVLLKNIWSPMPPQTCVIKRFDPLSGLITNIIGGLPEIHKILIGPDGMIAGLTQDGLIRIDPADPTNYQLYTDPAFADPVFGFGHIDILTLDTDGNYLIQATEYTGGLITRESLAKIDRQIGKFTEDVPDLSVLFPMTFQPAFYASAVGTREEIFLGKVSGDDIARINRGSVISGDLLSTLGTVPGTLLYSLIDMEYIAAGLAGDWDNDGDVDGKDLAILIANLSSGTATVEDLEDLITNFGR